MNLFLKTAVVALTTTFIFAGKSSAQTETPAAEKDTVVAKPARNVFFELYGPGLFSFNYDTRFSNRRDGAGIRVGFGFLGSSSSNFTTVPVQLNYLLGEKGKYFELGIGATYLRTKDDTDGWFSFDGINTVIGTTTIGYRRQPVNGGFNFRASANPIFTSEVFYPLYFGVSFGYTFK